MAKRRVVPKQTGKRGSRPTKSDSRAGRRRGAIDRDLPHAEGGAGERAAEDTFFAAHASAVIDPGVTIGAGTRIWHWSHVMTGARIGRGCSLGQNVFVGTDVVIGDRVKIRDEHHAARGGRGRCHATSVGDSAAATQDRRLMPASFVDLPAHLCPNWGPATLDD